MLPLVKTSGGVFFALSIKRKKGGASTAFSPSV